MKIKKIVALVLALALMCALAACGGGSGSETDSNRTDNANSGSETVYTVTIGHAAAEDLAQHQCALAIKEYLEENGNGRFNVSVYPNSQLGANREMTEAVLEGNLTMLLTSSGTQTNFVPSSAVFDVPFVWADEAAMEKTIYDKDFLAALNAEHEAAGFRLVMLTHSSFRQISAKKPIHTPADCKKLVIRTQENNIQMKTWELLGANPTPLAYNEVYTALQQGTVEAQDNPLELFTAQKFYEQQKFFIRTNYLGYVGMWIMNNDFYQSLPDDLREIFDAACEAGLARNEEYAETSNAEKIQLIQDHGLEVIDLTDQERAQFKEATAPVIDDIKEVVSSEVWTAFENTLE